MVAKSCIIYALLCVFLNTDNFIAAESDICKVVPEPGLCRGSYPVFFYDQTKNRCEQFLYGGCSASGKEFVTREACEVACKPVCYEPINASLCRGSFPVYFYDKTRQQCKQSMYGGCSQNGVYFGNPEECESVCKSASESQ